MRQNGMLIGAALLAVAGVCGVCDRAPASAATLAEMQGRIPPVSAGMARVWFLRQFQPNEGLRMPTVYANGTPIASSEPGTAAYRDFPAGTYTFSVETCTVDTNQATTLNLTPGSGNVLEVQSLSNFRSWGCPADSTFYLRPIPPQRAQYYSTQLAYVGAR